MERRAAIGALVLGIAVMVVKFVAFEITGSSAVFSDAMESIVNVLAALMALYALWLAHLPADADHPYGHGKVEFLSAAVEGGMILVAAGAIAFDAAGHLFARPELVRLDWGIGLIAATSVLNLAGGLMLVKVGKRSRSMALEADGKHLLSDAATSLAVVAAMVAVQVTGWVLIDPLVALAAAGVLVYMGLKLVRRAAVGLMDTQDAGDGVLLSGILDAHAASAGGGLLPRICSYHKLRHRHVGRHHWVDFHVQVPAEWSVAEAHKVASLLEIELEQALGDPSDAMAHVEPCVGCAACGRGGSLRSGLAAAKVDG